MTIKFILTPRKNRKFIDVWVEIIPKLKINGKYDGKRTGRLHKSHKI